MGAFSKFHRNYMGVLHFIGGVRAAPSRLLTVLTLVFLAVAQFGRAEDELDASVLRHAGVSTDVQAVAEYLDRNTPADIPPDELDRQIKLLGSDRFTERDIASQKLVEGGPAVIGALKVAGTSTDSEVATRSLACIERIARDWDTSRTLTYTAAVRYLIRRNEQRDLRVLLRVLPTIREDRLAMEIWTLFDKVTSQAGKIPAECLAAASDRMPIRRALAGYLLARRGNAEQQRFARKLLEDLAPEVRLRTVQGLLGSGHFDEISVLVGLLSATPTNLALQRSEPSKASRALLS
jgi:hypothetical protein